METYNDYENMVYGYLKNYTQFKAKSKDIAIRINSLTEQINSVADIKASRSDSIYSSNHEVKSSVELAFEQKQIYLEKLFLLKRDKQKIDELINRLDSAITMLEPTASDIVRMRYIYNYKWTAISLKTKFSERNCQRIGIGAISKITEIIFGNFIYEQSSLFIFVDNQYKTCG